jgi:hypothetical protein
VTYEEEATTTTSLPLVVCQESSHISNPKRNLKWINYNRRMIKQDHPPVKPGEKLSLEGGYIGALSREPGVTVAAVNTGRLTLITPQQWQGPW